MKLLGKMKAICKQSDHLIQPQKMVEKYIDDESVISDEDYRMLAKIGMKFYLRTALAMKDKQGNRAYVNCRNGSRRGYIRTGTATRHQAVEVVGAYRIRGEANYKMADSLQKMFHDLGVFLDVKYSKKEASKKRIRA